MSLLAARVLWLAGLALSALTVAHLLSRSRPRDAILPTARFVPEGPARAPTRARTPTDLLLLAVRAAMIALIGFAFARPVFDARRRDSARVFIVDASWHASGVQEARAAVVDSVRRRYQRGDVILAFDTVARRVETIDALAPLPPGDAPGSLSVALIAAVREAAVLARGADSIELVLVSPLDAGEIDSATFAIRALWPGSIRMIRSAARTPPSPDRPIDVRAAADDPLRPAIDLAGGVTDADVRVVRDRLTPDDSTWVRTGPRVLIAWPRDPATGHLVARARTDSAGAVTAGGRVIIAPFQRSAVPMAGRTVARWVDGVPAATEAMNGAGCIRSVAISLPAGGDLTLRPAFGPFLRELLGPCGQRRTASAATDDVVTRLAGTGAPVGADDVRSERSSEPGRAAWLLGGALVLAALEQLLRRRLGADVRSDRSLPQLAGADA